MEKELQLVRQRLVSAEVERKDALYQLSQVRKEKANPDLVKLYIKHASNAIDRERDLWEREKNLYNARYGTAAAQAKQSPFCLLPDNNEGFNKNSHCRSRDADSDSLEWRKRREHLDTLMKMTS